MPSALTFSMKRSKARELKVFSANAVMPLSVTSWAFAAVTATDASAANAAMANCLFMSSLPFVPARAVEALLQSAKLR